MRPFRAIVVRRTLRYLLPIGGFFSLVLWPMVALYEHSRTQTEQARLEVRLKEATLRASNVLHVARANNGQLLRNGDVLSPTSLSVASRDPLVSNALQRQPFGVVTTDQGVFAYNRDAGRLAVDHPQGKDPPRVDGKGLQAPVPVVTQAPTDALKHPSLFAQPSGLALIGLLYGLVIAGSVSLASEQGHLENQLDHERRLLERQQAIQDSSGVAMGVCDPATGRLQSVNPAFCSFFDTPAQQLLQCTWEQLTHPDDRLTSTTLAEKLTAGDGNTSRTRQRFLKRDGSTTWGDLVVTCTRGADGSIGDLVAQITDVNELVNQAMYLEAASSAGVIGVWDWDMRTNALNWDVQMYRLYGVTDPQGIATYDLWQQAVHPDDREMAMEALHNALLGSDPFDCQFRVIWPDRSVHDIRARGTIQFNHAGQPERMVGVNYDVSELVRKSAYLEAAATAGVVGVWDWDITNDALTWDPVMVRLYGLRADEFEASRATWERAVHPDDQGFVAQEVQAALSGWRDYQPRFRVIWPDGSIHHIQARSRTTYRDDGSPVRMLGVNYDVTEQVEREQEVEQQRAQLAATLDALLDPLLFLTLETSALQPPALRIAEVNPAACSFFNRNHGQLVGQPLSVVVSEELNGDLIAALHTVCRKRIPWVADEHPLALSERSESLYLDVRAVAGRDGVVFSFRDVTDRRHAALQLAQSEERFRLLAENASDVVFLNTDGLMRWISPALTTMLGWSPADWVGQPFEEFVHPDDIALALCRRDDINAGATCITRLRLRDQAERWRWMEVHSGPYCNPGGDQMGIAGSMRTIDEEVAREAELERRARVDALTGLLNRKEIFDRLAQIMESRRQDDAAVAVLFCDIDHFKAINDKHGHRGGDAVLAAMANRLIETTRHDDLVGRIGGDELLVVLSRMPSLEAAVAIAQKLHTAIRNPLALPTGEVMPTLSIGVTLIHEAESVEAVVDRADQAMYQAKQAGRDRVISFT